MSPVHVAAALLLAACLLLAPAIASDAVFLRPRGWPQVECRLSTQHASNAPAHTGEDSRVDFWLRGALSRQFYRCTLDAPEDVRASVLAADRGGLLTLAARWTVNLNKFRRSHWPDSFQVMSATRTPQLSCLSGATALPAAVFPLTARRPGGPWSKCSPVPDKPHLDRGLLTADGVLTVQFYGGAPTIACAVSRGGQTTSLPMHAIVPPPYACFFATYLDFPALSDPPPSEVFQKLVADKWVPPSSSSFPPFQCWSADDDPSREFHFDVLFDGKHAHRCLFKDERQVSTGASIQDSSSGDGQATGEDSYASPDSLLVSKLNFEITGADGIGDDVTTPYFVFAERYTSDH